MNNLEKRIREVASKMEGKFMGTVPHSVFVEWDSTWDIAEEIDPEWGSPCNENSTDEEIEEKYSLSKVKDNVILEIALPF